MKTMRSLDILVTVLLIVGAINWGLIGFFDFNLVTAIFGEGAVTKVIYALVGLGGLYEIGCFTFGLRKTHERWCETLSAVKH